MKEEKREKKEEKEKRKKGKKSIFFFKQKTAYEIYQCDWSSDVCSSDLNFNLNIERETGFEPATNSLEGCDSSQLSYSRFSSSTIFSIIEQIKQVIDNKTVGREGIEPPQALPTDLQSAPTLLLRRLPNIPKINEQQIYIHLFKKAKNLCR